MCGRFRLTRTDRLARLFDLPETGETPIPPRYNIAPSQDILAIIHDGTRQVSAAMRWGFQPAWMTAPKQPPPINARAEGIAESRLFRSALLRGRCLIPADGFYEWKAVAGRTTKQLYSIQLADGDVFTFAGLWTPGPEEGLKTAAIITTAANALMASIHHRMPVILSREQAALWLDPAVRDPGVLLALLQPYPADQMTAYPISMLVNSTRNQGPEILLPAP